MVFTFVLFIAPQAVIPALAPLHLAEISGGLAIAAYVASRLGGGRPLTVVTAHVRLALGLLGLAVLSVPFSSWPGGSVDFLLGKISKTLLIFVLLANTINSVARMRLMMGSMILWGAYISASALADFASGRMMIEGGLRVAGYTSPLAMDPNDLALTLNLMLGLAIGLYGAARSLPVRTLLLAGMGLLLAGSVVSMSRGGFLMLVTIAAVVLVQQAKSRGLGVIVPVVVFVLGAWCFVPAGYTERMYSIIDFARDPTGSAQGRWDGMVSSLKIILGSPLVGAGVGTGTLAFVERGEGWQLSHNAFLQVGIDLGVPGLLVYVLLVWRTLLGILRVEARVTTARKADGLAGLANGLKIATVTYAVGSSFLPVAYHFYFFYLAGFAIAAERLAGPPAGTPSGAVSRGKATGARMSEGVS